VSALLRAFEELFEAEGVTEGLSRRELERVADLRKKYRSPD
jgi:hypothetical protein